MSMVAEWIPACAGMTGGGAFGDRCPWERVS